ncbi:MAG: hypothetical protein A2075_10335 [Geobacteraceae bacterium GWC2_58_44]|nr:MAG: hypothetical protein A2075_10335 [Geobacteraceae bacterium GWC2_58_44]HBG04546.1 hypothetical protein [Geobacter sp.]
MARTAAVKQIRFTDKYISGLKPEAARYFRREARGFAIRVMPTGLKTWFYIYTWKGSRKHMNLGAYPGITLAKARELYTAAYTLHQQGIDPSPDKDAEQPAADNTFGYFAKLYQAWALSKHSIGYNTTIKYALPKHILPYWSDLDISKIGRRDAVTLLERVALTAPGNTTNICKVASAVFDYAIQREYIELNPMYRLAKAVPALKQTYRDRTLVDSEIRHIWKAIDAGPGDAVTKRALKLILVTAQRPGEVAGMHRREIEGSTWTIPRERMKMKVGDHIVHLTPTALELIGDAEGYIFPTNSDVPHMGRAAMSGMVARKATNREGIIRDTNKLPYYGLPRWTPHDLRRTARTNMSRCRIPSEHSEAVIAHGKPGIQKVYDKWEYLEEKKEALQKWEALLLTILN